MGILEVLWVVERGPHQKQLHKVSWCVLQESRPPSLALPIRLYRNLLGSKTFLLQRTKAPQATFYYQQFLLFAFLAITHGGLDVLECVLRFLVWRQGA